MQGISCTLISPQALPCKPSGTIPSSGKVTCMNWTWTCLPLCCHAGKTGYKYTIEPRVKATVFSGICIFYWFGLPLQMVNIRPKSSCLLSEHLESMRPHRNDWVSSSKKGKSGELKHITLSMNTKMKVRRRVWRMLICFSVSFKPVHHHPINIDLYRASNGFLWQIVSL